MARLAKVPPIAIASGDGAWLFDDEGNRYFDTVSSWWVNILGHANPRIVSAISEQASKLPHVMLGGCTHEPAVRLAERLSKRANGHLGHAFFASDGASAVEIALKQSFHSRAIKGEKTKEKFLCLKHSYHGETIGALSVTDVPLFQDAYRSLLNASYVIEAPDSRLNNEREALDALKQLLQERHGEISALIIEPLIQCGGGMVMHSSSYLRGVRALTKEFDVHLIADEIAVGCGRTGTFFAWDQVSDSDWPDFLLLSKGISGGNLPLSIVLTSDEVFNQFLSEDFRAGFLHSHSYTGNPLACAAANVVLDHFDEGLTEQLSVQTQHLADAFIDFASDERVTDFRQCGMVVAFEVSETVDNFAEKFHVVGRRHEILIRPIGNTVYVMPPYLITREYSEFIVDALSKTLNETLS
jgi:adenosylmethionine-8-amino-7-oxononanoate aminotransferase